MDVNMGAFGNGRDSLADGPAVFDDGFVQGQIAHGDLVAERHIAHQFYRSGGLPLQGDDANFTTFLQIFNGDADVVFEFVQENTMFHIFNIKSNCILLRVDGLLERLFLTRVGEAGMGRGIKTVRIRDNR